MARFWLQGWPLEALARGCPMLSTAGSKQLQQTWHRTQLRSAATPAAPLGKTGERGQCREKRVQETTLQIPVPERDVEGMPKTAELSFLSLWDRAKCSIPAVCGEGCVRADTPISALQTTEDPTLQQVGIPLKGATACGEPVLEQGLARKEPSAGAGAPEGNCSS